MATFNGTDKSTCPNMDEPAGQERFAEFINFGHTIGEGNIDPQFGTSDFNRICFNICETVIILGSIIRSIPRTSFKLEYSELFTNINDLHLFLLAIAEIIIP